MVPDKSYSNKFVIEITKHAKKFTISDIILY